MEDKWSGLWWDSEEIHKLRKQVQRPKSREELWCWLTLRRVSLYVAIALSRTEVSPNSITVASVVLTFLCGIWLAFTKSVNYLVLFVLYNVIYLLDCVDGELARLTQRFSSMGVWLDRMLHLGLMVMHLSLLIHLLVNTLSTWAPVITVLVLSNRLLSFWLSVGAPAFIRDQQATCMDAGFRARKESALLDWFVMVLGSPPGLYGGLAILSLLLPSTLAYIAWFAVHEASEAAKNLWRIRLLLQSVEG